MSLVIDAAVTLISGQLGVFANQDDFWSLFDVAFGKDYNKQVALKLKTQWLKGDFSSLPSVEVISSNVLGNANGAYASSTNQIYLSASFLNTALPAAIVNVILEEIGHYVDAQVNQVDSAGDEGAIFAALVQGEVLSPGVLAELKTEDDRGWLKVNGQKLEVEYNTYGSLIFREGDQIVREGEYKSR